MEIPDRLDALEVKVSYLEEDFRQLNTIVLELQKSLSRVSDEVQKQKSLLLNLRESLGDPIESQRPPHY